MDASEFGKCTQDPGPGTAIVRALLILITNSQFWLVAQAYAFRQWAEYMTSRFVTMLVGLNALIV